jgi:hypothetical protein
LEAALDAGPAMCGWSEQCWTLARIAEVVRRRFGVTHTLAGLDVLLHRIGWSVQVPARQAAERDETKVAVWKDEQWPAIKGWAADLRAWLCFDDEAGQGLRPQTDAVPPQPPRRPRRQNRARPPTAVTSH